MRKHVSCRMMLLAFFLACPLLGVAKGKHQQRGGDQAATMSIIIKNKLQGSLVPGACVNGSTLTVFLSGNRRVLIAPGAQQSVTGVFSVLPGMGLQINNWYWTTSKYPVQSKNPQNPDNSGAQFTLTKDCVISGSKAWYGDGIATYLVADVTATMNKQNMCVVTVSPNSYTAAVTPECCSPPDIGNDTCTDHWGVTNTRQAWPPS